MKSPMTTLFAIVPFLIGCGVVVTAAVAAEDVGKSYHVYHKLGNSKIITSRGTIKIAPSDDDGVGLVATFHPDNSAQLDTAEFDNMVESNALYTIIVKEGVNDDDAPQSISNNNSQQHVLASVPGCSIRRSNLREEIGLSINPTGKLLSVSYRPIISPLAPKTCQNLPSLSEKPDAIFGRKTGEDNDEGTSAMPFKTTVSFDSHTPMMVIPTVLPQQRPPPGLNWYRKNSKNNPNPLLGTSSQEGGGIPGVPDEQPSGFKSSFLYRYWYIILPMAIMGLFGGVDEEEVKKAAAERAAASGGGAGQSTTAAAGGAVAASATQVKQRRGKRD